MEEIKLNIFRYDSSKNKKPYYEIYLVPWRQGLTVLDALNHIGDYIDSSLSFRQSCRSAVCGSCTIRVDKRGCLACRTQITRQTTQITIDPLNHFKIIKDLVVDLEPFYERMRQVQPYLVRANAIPVTEKEKILPDALKEATHLAECILCGSCYSDCNTLDVDNSFCGPAALIKAINPVRKTGGGVHIKRSPATDMFPEYIKEFDGNYQAEILLFLGCIINRRKQNVAKAIINILQKNRVAIHLPKKVTC